MSSTVSYHQRPSVLRAIGLTLVWGFVAFCLFAFVFMLVSSFKSSNEIFKSPWGLPGSLRFENWAHAWNDLGFAKAAVNSIIVVGCSSIAVVAMAAPAAYALSRRATRLSEGITVFFAVGLGIPMQIIVLPLFSLLAKFNLINSLRGLILVYIAISLPFAVFLLTSFFRSLPSELEEAAALDGVSPAGTFLKIMLPLARGGLLTTLMLTAMSLWNETLLSLMFVQSQEKRTIPLALLSFVQASQNQTPDYGAIFAGVSITILPMLLLYLWLGRRITDGLTVGVGK